MSVSSHEMAEDQDFLLQLDGMMALVLSVFMVFSRENPVDEPGKPSRLIQMLNALNL